MDSINLFFALLGAATGFFIVHYKSGALMRLPRGQKAILVALLLGCVSMLDGILRAQLPDSTEPNDSLLQSTALFKE